MKALVVGAGSFGRKHAAILNQLDDVTVTAFCSRSSNSAEEAAASLAPDGSVGHYTDLADALDREHPDIAVVAVTPGSHGAIEDELVARSIPFLVEKPIGVDRETPERIANAVEKKSLVTSVAFHMRYLDTVDRLKEGLAGRTPVLANAFWMGTLPPPAWWRHRKDSGGQLIEQTVHMVDLLRFVLGEVVSVQAVASQQVIASLHADADVPDAGAALFTMANGMTATVINSCIAPVYLRVGLEVVTRERFFSFEPGKLVVRRADGTDELVPAVDPYELEDKVFVDAVRTGDASAIRSSYADALRTHHVCMAITDAIAAGARIDLP